MSKMWKVAIAGAIVAVAVDYFINPTVYKTLSLTGK